jgi:ribosomal protein S18 acetylase RimI-like enzyme
MEISTLQGISNQELYKAFSKAFAGYQVQMELSFEQFTELITSRNFSRNHSMGCFIDGQLIGFNLCGVRNYQKKWCAYDIATGVIDGYRNKGIAKVMLQHQLELLKSKNFESFQLEVLEENKAAYALYMNNGFEVIRKLNCYEMEKENLSFPSVKFHHFDKNLRKFSQTDVTDFQTCQPTWQNDLVTVGNSIDAFYYVAIENGGKMVAYGFVHINNGRIPQIGIHPNWRNRGLETALFQKLIGHTKSKTISIVNVETESYLNETLDKLGFAPKLVQFEMLRLI